MAPPADAPLDRMQDLGGRVVPIPRALPAQGRPANGAEDDQGQADERQHDRRSPEREERVVVNARRVVQDQSGKQQTCEEKNRTDSQRQG